MNILYVTYEFPGEMPIGGLATYINNISSIMRRHGHNVMVLTLSDKQSREYVLENGVKIITVQRYKYQGRLVTKQKSRIELVMNAWNIYRKLIFYKSKYKIDIVQSANIGGVGLFRTEIPTIVRLSSDGVLCREAQKYVFCKEQFENHFQFEDWVEYIIEKKADAVFAPGEIIGNIVSKRIRKHVFIIESPFYMGDLKEDRKAYDEKLLNKKYFLTHGSLHNQKGTKVLADALYILLSKYKDVYFVFAGADYYINKNSGWISAIVYLKKAAREYADRVIYLGVLPKNQLIPIIKEAMACILPSRIENLSNSCTEAMGLKKIVIATYKAGYEQLIQNKVNGLLFKRDSQKALISAVNFFLSMNKEQKEIMEVEAGKIAERLNENECYKKHIQLYLTTVKTKRSENGF